MCTPALLPLPAAQAVYTRCPSACPQACHAGTNKAQQLVAAWAAQTVAAELKALKLVDLQQPLSLACGSLPRQQVTTQVTSLREE